VREVLIDLEAVAHNTKLLVQAAGDAKVMAMVKADGFGHGAVAVARTALRHGVSWLGVTSPWEALALRHANVTAPMLTWLYAPDDDLAPLLEADVDLSVPSTAHLRAVAMAATKAAIRANIHLKVDTCLSRDGAALAEWRALVAMARQYEESGVIHVRGMWSHLTETGVHGDPSTSRQISQFQAASRAAEATGVRPALRHIAGSAALLHNPESRFDLVRAGIALYGVEPIPGYSRGLRPALTVTAAVLLVKRVYNDGTPPYGYDHVTDRATNLALLAMGFANGVPRRATGRAEVLIHGVRCRVAGRIAMDHIVVDVGDLPVRAGDQAVVLGPGDQGEPTATDWATWADTNAHEILTGIGSRVPRRYRLGDEADSAP